MEDKKSGMQKQLKKLFVQFAIYCCSDVLAFSALNFTLNLQSSINVEDGLGECSQTKLTN